MSFSVDMNNFRFTASLQKVLINFLTEMAKKQKITKRKILEEALEMYRKQKIKQEMLKGYNTLADDTEEMNEWISIANNPKNL